jgi:hypothetical protein
MKATNKVHFHKAHWLRKAGCGEQVYVEGERANWGSERKLRTETLPEKITCASCVESLIAQKKKELKRVEDRLFELEGFR